MTRGWDLFMALTFVFRHDTPQTGTHYSVEPNEYNAAMNTPNFPTAALAEDDVNTCVRVLRAIEADRSLLTALTQERRRELLTLAGLVTRPERHDVTRMAKAFRRADREAAKQHDREVSDSAGLRVQRRAEVYAPLWLEPPGPQEADDRPAFQQARACYVCKQALRSGASIL